MSASVAVALYGDVREVGDALGRLRPRLLLPALALGFGALVLRWLRWHRFLYLVSPTEQLRAAPSAGVYAAGAAMKVTPGQVGEWVKSYYVETLGGASAARTSSIVFAERITDTIALLLLASSGLVVYRTAFWVVGFAALIPVALLVSLRHPSAAAAVSRVMMRVPVLRRLFPHLDEFYAAARTLLTWRRLTLGIVLGFAAWAAEAGAYWFALWGVGVEPSWTLLLQAAFGWAVATLAGGLLLTPAGLGVAEGGLVALAVTLVDGLGRGPAAAAALLSRLVTLWLGVALGLLTMALFARGLGRRARPHRAGPVPTRDRREHAPVQSRGERASAPATSPASGEPPQG